jgi:hypothetical protein
LKRDLLLLYLSIIGFKNVLLDHSMGVEERAIEGDAVAHHLEKPIAFLIKSWDNYSLETSKASPDGQSDKPARQATAHSTARTTPLIPQSTIRRER